VLWLELDEMKDAGPFLWYGAGISSMDGIVTADREPQPELWQIKKGYAPVRVEAVDLAKGRVRVENLYAFTNLSERNVRWTLSTDDRIVQSGALALDIAPHAAAEVVVPFRSVTPAPGVAHWLTLTVALKDAAPWAPAGHEVAFAQFELPGAAVPRTSTDESTPDLAVDDTAAAVTLRGPDFTYRFDRKTGTLASMIFRGQELLSQGPVLDVFRAPVSNEISTWGKAESVEWYALGLDRLVHTVKAFDVSRVSSQRIEVHVRVRSQGPENLEFIDSAFTYSVTGRGEVQLRHEVTPVGAFIVHWLPRVGVALRLPPRFDHLTWYGRGPHETYPDRKTGARMGVWSGTVGEQFVSYLPPQDNGNKTDVRWAAITDASGVGLLARADPDMNISVSEYDNIARAAYPFQLQKSGVTTWTLSHRVSGVGETPTTTLPEYRVPAQRYDYTLRLKPFSAADGSPLEVAWRLQGAP
jgi:beta-galactosidase